jgi:DNA-binding response OmpR family regulator
MLKLYVWHDVLRDYRAGIAFALAESESQAWEELKKHDYQHWWLIAGMPGKDGTPEDIVTRPACYDTPIGFSISGGQ